MCNLQTRMRRKNKRNGKNNIFVDRGKQEEKRKKNHRKCDNKNEIYELRLVIYLCANLLLPKEKAMKTKRGVQRHYYVTSEKEKMGFKKNLFHASK